MRARASGKGVLTAPFRLLKSNRLGVILTFAVYKRDLPSNATPDERIQATDGYIYCLYVLFFQVLSYLQLLSFAQQWILSCFSDTKCYIRRQYKKVQLI